MTRLVRAGWNRVSVGDSGSRWGMLFGIGWQDFVQEGCLRGWESGRGEMSCADLK